MHKYLSYSKEDLSLIQKCTQLQRRSKSREANNSAKAKQILSLDRDGESLEGTKRIGKLLGAYDHLDDLSTLKKTHDSPGKKQPVQQVTEFVIQEERNEDSSLLPSQNSKSKTSYVELGQENITRLQKQMLDRIDELKSRLEYRIYVNTREIMKRPAYGKYITSKYNYLQE